MESFNDVFNKIVSSSKMSFSKNPYDKRGGMKEFDDDVEMISSHLKNSKESQSTYNQIRFIIRNLEKNTVLTSRGFKTDGVDKMPKFFPTKNEAREYLIQVYKIDPFKSSSFNIDKVSIAIVLSSQKA